MTHKENIYPNPLVGKIIGPGFCEFFNQQCLKTGVLKVIGHLRCACGEPVHSCWSESVRGGVHRDVSLGTKELEGAIYLPHSSV